MSEQTLIFFLQLLFYILFPAFFIYLKIIKKFKFLFTIGLCLSSFLLGLIIISTVKKKDEIADFIRYVNANQYEKAKREYKIIIQYGPEYVGKIKKDKIDNVGLYKQLTSDLIEEYNRIVEKYITKYRYTSQMTGNIDYCHELVNIQKKQERLKHALLLLRFSGSIGGDIADLKSRVKNVEKHNHDKLVQLQKKCKKDQV